MKRLLIAITFVLLLTACVRPAPATDAAPLPTATYMDLPALTTEPDQPPEPVEAEPAEAEPTAEPGETESDPTPEAGEPEPTVSDSEPTTESEPAATEEPEPEPTARPEPTATQAPLSGAPDLDPIAAFGAARFDEQFADGGQHWAAWDGSLPDTDNIRLTIEDQIMAVTGKYAYFDTWWFSAPYMGDMYIEVTLNTGECSEDDAYGVILRGPPRGEPAHGYIVAFTCDGRFFVRRLDSADPYTVEAIFIPTESEYIVRGANRENLLGVLLREDQFTIYANNHQIGTFTDATYELGRYGVFVSPGPTADYTYYISRIRVWDLRAK